MRWGSRECMKAGGGGRCSRFGLWAVAFYFIPDFHFIDQDRGRRWLGSIELAGQRIEAVLNDSKP